MQHFNCFFMLVVIENINDTSNSSIKYLIRLLQFVCYVLNPDFKYTQHVD